MYKEIEGNLITLAKEGMFDVITHGCNCMCNMGAGIAPQMAKAFGCNLPEYYPLEHTNTRGDINKLGQIDCHDVYIGKNGLIHHHNLGNLQKLSVINSYSQYVPAAHLKPLDYEALTLCMRKIRHKFGGLKIGLPRIGAGLAGGDWEKIKLIIQDELSNCDVTIVIYNPK